MPELPEVETMCRGLSPIIGREIRSVSRPVCRYRPISFRPGVAKMERMLAGRLVSGVSRLGKRVLIHVDRQRLILQPKMTGLVALEAPPDETHVRLQIEFVGLPQIRLLFWDRRGLGTVELLREDQIQSALIDGKLGPDALTIEPAEFAARLRGTRRPIKVALLDQKLVAGVGNLYASEILHLSGIRPTRAANRVPVKRLVAVHANMLVVLHEAIRYEGSTLSDGTYRNALNSAGGYQNHHRVYDRAGQPCLTCGAGPVKRIVQAQRATFYCPGCQV